MLLTFTTTSPGLAIKNKFAQRWWSCIHGEIYASRAFVEINFFSSTRTAAMKINTNGKWETFVSRQIFHAVVLSSLSARVECERGCCVYARFACLCIECKGSLTDKLIILTEATWLRDFSWFQRKLFSSASSVTRISSGRGGVGVENVDECENLIKLDFFYKKP